MSLAHKVDAVKRLAGSYRAVLELADELEKLGSVEQACAEAESRLATARAALEVLNAQANEAGKVKAEALRGAEEAVAAAQLHADTLRGAGASESRQRIAEAVEEAEAHRATARRDAETITASARSSAEAVREAALKAKAEIEKQAERRAGELAELETKVASKRAELDEVERAMAAIRERVQAS